MGNIGEKGRQGNGILNFFWERILVFEKMPFMGNLYRGVGKFDQKKFWKKRESQLKG